MNVNKFIEPDDENYIRRRDHLLKSMKRQNWDDDIDDSPKTPRGRKPKPHIKTKQDLNKGRNKFFK